MKNEALKDCYEALKYVSVVRVADYNEPLKDAIERLCKLTNDYSIDPSGQIGAEEFYYLLNKLAQIVASDGYAVGEIDGDFYIIHPRALTKVTSKKEEVVTVGSVINHTKPNREFCRLIQPFPTYKRVGFVGYSMGKFDIKKAKKIIKKIFNRLQDLYGDKVEIISGLTAYGIPLLVYEEARRRNLKTVGYSPKKALDLKQFPVDEKYIIGDDWGDESKEFINNIDLLIRIGGGNQSRNETELAKKKGIEVIEYEL